MPRYIVGSNMPGYMPDSIPEESSSLEEARVLLEEEIVRSYDSLYAPLVPFSSRDEDVYLEALKEARAATGPVEIYYGDWVHWIAPAE